MYKVMVIYYDLVTGTFSNGDKSNKKRIVRIFEY